MGSKKDEFVDAFEKVSTMHPKGMSPKVVADILNKNPNLKRMFREAVATVKDIEGSGMAQLFGGFDES